MIHKFRVFDVDYYGKRHDTGKIVECHYGAPVKAVMDLFGFNNTTFTGMYYAKQGDNVNDISITYNYLDGGQKETWYLVKGT
jgi:hypothetical protein